MSSSSSSSAECGSRISWAERVLRQSSLTAWSNWSSSSADRVLGLVRAVRDGEEVAHVRGHRLLALEHRVHVGGGDGSGVDQELARLADGVVLALRGARDLDLGQGQHVAHGTPRKVVRPAGTTDAGAGRPVGQREDEVSCVLVVFSSSTMASYCGLFMKLSTDTCWAEGDMLCARGVRS